MTPIHFDPEAAGGHSLRDLEQREKLFVQLFAAFGGVAEVCALLGVNSGLVLIEADSDDLCLTPSDLKRLRPDRTKALAEFDLVVVPADEGRASFGEAINIEVKLMIGPDDFRDREGKRRRKKKQELAEQLRFGSKLFRRTFGLLLLTGDLFDAFETAESTRFGADCDAARTNCDAAGMVAALIACVPGSDERQCLAFDPPTLLRDAERMTACEIGSGLERFVGLHNVAAPAQGFTYVIPCPNDGVPRACTEYQLIDARCEECGRRLIGGL